MTGHLVTKEKTDTAKEDTHTTGRPSASARTVAIGKAPTSADLDISRHTSRDWLPSATATRPGCNDPWTTTPRATSKSRRGADGDTGGGRLARAGRRGRQTSDVSAREWGE